MLCNCVIRILVDCCRNSLKTLSLSFRMTGSDLCRLIITVVNIIRCHRYHHQQQQQQQRRRRRRQLWGYLSGFSNHQIIYCVQGHFQCDITVAPTYECPTLLATVIKFTLVQRAREKITGRGAIQIQYRIQIDSNIGFYYSRSIRLRHFTCFGLTLICNIVLIVTVSYFCIYLFIHSFIEKGWNRRLLIPMN